MRPDARTLARRLRASPILRRVAAICAPTQVHLTGGCLRDRVLGRVTHDLDLVVEGDGRSMAERLASRLGTTAFPLGHEPAITWRVVSTPWHLDVWGVTPGTLREDVLRRDFAVNALLWRLPDGPLVDLAGGFDDLAAGRLRVIRADNLRADPLRVLRGVRLLATHLELSLPASSEALLSAAAPGLVRVARERILEELRQTVSGPGVRRALRAGARLGIFGVLHHSWTRPAHLELITSVAFQLASLMVGRPTRLAAGARAVAPAIFGAPAAALPRTWDAGRASAALSAMAWPPRMARELAAAVAAGERLGRVLRRGGAEARGAAADLGELLPAAAAWAVARAAVDGSDLVPEARRLLRWQRRFYGLPPLLRGDEIAALLDLPAGPERAETVAALRRARARGEVRTRREALRWLVSRRKP